MIQKKCSDCLKSEYEEYDWDTIKYNCDECDFLNKPTEDLIMNDSN